MIDVIPNFTQIEIIRYLNNHERRYDDVEDHINRERKRCGQAILKKVSIYKEVQTLMGLGIVEKTRTKPTVLTISRIYTKLVHELVEILDKINSSISTNGVVENLKRLQK